MGKLAIDSAHTVSQRALDSGPGLGGCCGYHDITFVTIMTSQSHPRH